MSKDKVHYFTAESYSNPNSDMVWYHSGCKLIAAGAPTNNISEVTCKRCKSYLMKNHPRYQHHHYSGQLEIYFETGMECLATIFHDNRGLGGSNPNDNGRQFHSLAQTIWFGNKMAIYTIRVFDTQDNLVYEGSLKKDKYKIVRNKYQYSFLPAEVAEKDWLDWCRKEYRAELYTNELTSDFKEQHKLEHDVGDIVVDDLTGKDSVVINVLVDKNNNVGYWINNDYLDGGRLPTELTKIDWTARLRAEIAAEKAKNAKTD